MIRLLILGAVAALAACGDNVDPAPSSPAAADVAGAAQSAGPAAAATAAASGSAAAAATIPPNFRGEWNSSLADCGTGRNDTGLRVAPDRVVFPRGTATVRGVEQHAEDELSVMLEQSGERETTRWERRWRLADEGEILEDMTDASGLVRHRCPGGKS
jgi:hypothetical protein